MFSSRLLISASLCATLSACENVPPGQNALSGSSLFKTRSVFQPNDDFYTYLGTYYTRVETKLIISYNPKDGNKAESMSIASVAFPSDRRFLYLHKSPLLYSDSGSVATSSIGLLSSTEAQSQQELSTALSEIGKAASGLGPHVLTAAVKADGEPCHPPKAWTTTINLENVEDGLSSLSRKNKKVLAFNTPIDANTKIAVDATNLVADESIYGVDLCKGSDYSGFCVYEPASVEVWVECNDRSPHTILTEPKVIGFYKYRHQLNPTRDFFTSPHDTIQASDGVLPSQKHTNSSIVKGVTDVVTAPLRSIEPNTNVQTQYQTGGGKPDQYTTSTTYSTSPGGQ